MVEGHKVFAICDTEGCVNQHVYIAVPDNTNVVCGPCGNPINRLEENKPEEPKELPAWEI